MIRIIEWMKPTTYRSEPNADSVDRKRSRDHSNTKTTVKVRSTNRWRGIVAVILLAVAIGILAKRPDVLLVAAIGVAFATYPRVTSPPRPSISVDRQISPTSAKDGETVTVSTTVENEGDQLLFDLRIIDGVPPMLSVEHGSPRCATTLMPGGTATFEYELQARPGRHRFQPTIVLCRDASGSIEVETTAFEDETVECASEIPVVPLRNVSNYMPGSLVTDDSGEGLEFHSVKEYDRGDSISRIDWRRFARTGELSSIMFRTERLAEIVICVDARAASYRARIPSEPHAVAYSVDAAERIGEALFEANHRVGLAAFGDGLCLLPFGNGQSHADEFRRRLAMDPALTLAPPQELRVPRTRFRTDDSMRREETPLDTYLSKIRAQFGSNVQIYFLSPLCDDEASRIVQRFEQSGAVVTVVSPDVTTERTTGGKLAHIERECRVNALRSANIPVVDWDPRQSLGSALSTAKRWNQ